MEDLISRAAAIADIEEYLEEYSELDADGFHNLKWCAMSEAKDVLTMLPAVDAVPVVHGTWKSVKAVGGDGYPFWDAKCSECGYTIKNTAGYVYCPHCGAKMDGDENNALD